MKRSGFTVRHLVLAVGVGAAGDDDVTLAVTNATFCPPCRQDMEGAGLKQLRAQLHQMTEVR